MPLEDNVTHTNRTIPGRPNDPSAKPLFRDYVRARRDASQKRFYFDAIKSRVHQGKDLVPSARLEHLAAALHQHNRTIVPVPQLVDFLVLKGSKSVLAMATPGPMVFVSGRLERASNPVLAFVIAHELAHIALGHLHAEGPELVSWSRVLARRFIRRQEDEFEADRLAHRWCIDAGYGDGAIRFFDAVRMQYIGLHQSTGIPAGESSIARWCRKRLVPHPPVDERIAQLQGMHSYRTHR